MNCSAPTIHNAALRGQIAPTVLMPGDPQRASFIAENFLKEPKLLSNIRGIPVYSGSYHGQPVSVMASGMGVGSMGIYSYELFSAYEVEQIIRVGSAGGLHPSLRLRDVVIAIASHTDSGFANQYELFGTVVPCADFSLAARASGYAKQKDIRAIAGPIFSGVAFHYEDAYLKRWAEMGALAVEMESAALYLNAARLGKRALALCTISDLVFTGEHCSPKERETSFEEMIRMALELL